MATSVRTATTLFFDRSVGTTIPRTLRRLRIPTGIAYHQEHFARDAADDAWLPDVGSRGWTVIGFDFSYHKYPAEIAAIRQYGIGVFYLWGAQESTWSRICCFARAYDRIIRATDSTARPFIYRITKSGHLKQESLV